MPGEQQNCNPDQPSKNANTRHRGLLSSRMAYLAALLSNSRAQWKILKKNKGLNFLPATFAAPL
jgi:hypothetical protein